MLTRRDLSFRALRYTLDVMLAVTGTWAICHRPSRGSVARFPSYEKGSCRLRRRKRAVCGQDMPLRSGDYARASNFLIAMGVPARSRLRAPLAAPIWRDRARKQLPASGTPRGLRLPRIPLRSADRQGESLPFKMLSVSGFVGESLRVLRCLPGGFVQLASI